MKKKWLLRIIGAIAVLLSCVMFFVGNSIWDHGFNLGIPKKMDVGGFIVVGSVLALWLSGAWFASTFIRNGAPQT